MVILGCSFGQLTTAVTKKINKIWISTDATADDPKSLSAGGVIDSRIDKKDILMAGTEL
jgi:hypothetical protein